MDPMPAASSSTIPAPLERAARVCARSRARATWGILGLILVSFLSAPCARSEPADSTGSYWGAIPVVADTICVPLLEPPKPLWERAVLVPYRVVTYPVVLLSRGTGATISYLDRSSVLEDVGRLLGPRSGPFGLLFDFQFGGLSGLGGGVAAEHTKFFGERNTLRARASTTTKRDHRLGLAARFNRARASYFEVGAGYRRRPNVRFFGFGPDAREADESYFHQEAAWVGATLRRPLGGRSHLDLSAEYTNVGVGTPGKGHGPAAEDQFNAASLPGFGDHSFGMTFGGQWLHESAGLENRPGHGGIQRLRVAYFDGFDRSDARFWTFRGEAQHFITLWRPLRVLALRGVASWMENAGDAAIPLARLNTNDDPDLFRGYDDFRWRDRGIVIATAEYRWPIWAHQRPYDAGLDAYLLTDVGQVFHDADQIGVGALTRSYGGGLRVESGHGFVLRLEYARSDEASIIRLRADQVFQFTKGGFLHGREPIPER